MSYLLAVDPDVEAPGLALFRAGELVAAGRCRGAGSDLTRLVSLGDAAVKWVSGRLLPGDLIVEVAVEWPRVYPVGKGKPGVDPNDLIEVAAAAASVCAAFPRARHTKVPPRDWKGTIPKPKRAGDPYLVEARVVALLTPVERAVWMRDAAPVAPTPRLEITDAVGIGLHATGRPLVGERVIAR